MEIRNEIITNVKKYLLYESVIASEIKKISDEVISEINNQIINSPSKLYNKNISNIFYKNNIIIKEYKNISIKIEWMYINFTNNKTFDEYIKIILKENKSFTNKNYIKLVVIALNDKILSKRFENKVYHEITHCFQNYMKKGMGIVKRRPQQYNNAIMNVYSDNEIIATASKIVWLYHKFEQDAECHSLYGALMTSSSLEDMLNQYKKSEQHQDLSNIKNFVNNLSNNYDLLTAEEKEKIDLDINSHLNITLKSLLTRAKKLIKRLEIKYGKVWLQAQYDFRKNHKVNESIEPDFNIIEKNKLYEKTEFNEKFSIKNIKENLRGYILPIIIF